MPRKKREEAVEGLEETHPLPAPEPEPKKAAKYHCSFCNAEATPDPKGLHKCMCRRERLSA